MKQKNKPFLAERLGVEVGEWFGICGYDRHPDFSVDMFGCLKYHKLRDYEDIDALCRAIQRPDLVIHFRT